MEKFLNATYIYNNLHLLLVLQQVKSISILLSSFCHHYWNKLFIASWMLMNPFSCILQSRSTDRGRDFPHPEWLRVRKRTRTTQQTLGHTGNMMELKIQLIPTGEIILAPGQNGDMYCQSCTKVRSDCFLGFYTLFSIAYCDNCSVI